MHIPQDSLLLPCSKKPQVWDISGPFKYPLFQWETGVPRFIFGMSSGAPRLESTCHPPGCFSKGKSCFSEGKRILKPPLMELFPPLPLPPPRSDGKKKNTKPYLELFPFFPPFLPGLTQTFAARSQKTPKRRSSFFLYPLSTAAR